LYYEGEILRDNLFGYATITPQPISELLGFEPRPFSFKEN